MTIMIVIVEENMLRRGSHCGSRASVMRVNRRVFEDLPSRSHVSSSSITSWLSNSRVISDSTRKLTMRHSTETHKREVHLPVNLHNSASKLKVRCIYNISKAYTS